MLNNLMGIGSAVGNAIGNFFNKIMFNIIKILANIVDVIISLMRMLLGLDPVKVNESSSGKVNIVLDFLTEESTITAFFAVMGMSILCVFIFAIVRIIRNQCSDEKDDGAVSKSKAIKGVLTSVINMVILPIFVVCLVFAVTGVAQTMDGITSDNQDMNYGTQIIFSTVDEDTLETRGKVIWNGKADPLDMEEIKYVDCIQKDSSGNIITGKKAVMQYYEQSPSYSRICDLVINDEYFDKFILPLLGACIMVFALGMSCIVVGQRLFYCTFLFVISPFIVSTRPMDDGARWRKWCEVFLSKLMSSFAIVICLNLFFMLTGRLAQIQFFTDGFKNGTTTLVIYISGVIAATGANQLISQLIGADAGIQERDQAMNNFRSTMAGLQGARMATKAASSLAKKGTGTVGNFLGGKKNTPLTNYGTSSANTLASGATASGGSMASSIGKALMGKGTGFKQGSKNLGKRIWNSRPANIAKGAVILTGGVISSPFVGAKKAVKGIKKASKLNKKPELKSKIKTMKKENPERYNRIKNLSSSLRNGSGKAKKH